MSNVTREVISDLWPLYISGDLSPDTRRLIEEFLQGDPELARILAADGKNPLGGFQTPELPPDHELRTLQRIKRRLWGYPMLLQLALIFSGLAFGRIVADTSWDVSPRNFIVTSAVAFAFWIAFLVSLYRGRRALLVRLR